MRGRSGLHGHTNTHICVKQGGDTTWTFNLPVGLLTVNLLVTLARYLETYKAYESKPTDSIQERVDADHAAR